jgi:hypothetical protein
MEARPCTAAVHVFNTCSPDGMDSCQPCARAFRHTLLLHVLACFLQPFDHVAECLPGREAVDTRMQMATVHALLWPVH